MTKIYENDYLVLFDNGEIGLSDGVGYITTLEKNDVDNLYKAMKSLQEPTERIVEISKKENYIGRDCHLTQHRKCVCGEDKILYYFRYCPGCGKKIKRID